MSSYFLSYCINPIYLLNSIKEAQNCGLINGIFYAFLISVVFLYFILKAYFNNPHPRVAQQIVLFAIVVLGLVWIIKPSLVRHGYGQIWIGYNNIISNMLALGYTRVQAIAILQANGNSSELNLGLIESVGENSLITATSNVHSHTPSS
jgi:CDP-diglyceride synthetase